MSWTKRITGPECPQCGANGTHQAEQTAALTRYVCEWCDHHWAVRRSIDERTVKFRPVRCPFCDSKNCPVHTTRLPYRYHKCRGCGGAFRSEEV